MRLTAEQSLGQLFFTGVEGLSLSDDTRKYLKKVKPGGVFIHGRNIESAHQLFELCSEIDSLLDIPPFVSIDQEGGGRVDKLRSFMPPFPFNHDVASTGDDGLAFRQGELIGRALRLLGLNMDFAPVVDLSHPDADNAVGRRAYSTEKETTVKFASSFLKGMKQEGVLTCLKHFPGLGPTFTDSHKVLPVVFNDRGALMENDIAVFRELCGGADSVMIGHASYTAFDADGVPGTLSKNITTELLRNTLGFDGIAITDDLDMKALPQDKPLPHLFADLLNAGNDMLLVCHNFEAVKSGFARLKKDYGAKLKKETVDLKVERIMKAKEHLWKNRGQRAFREGEFRALCAEVEDTFGRIVRED